MPQLNIDNATANPAGFVPQKLTYEEFLRAYDGQYVEFVDDEVVIPMSVTQRHDDVTGFLLALLRVFVEERGLGKIHGEPYQMKMVIDGKIKGREPDIFFVKTENLKNAGEQFSTEQRILSSKFSLQKASSAIRKINSKNMNRPVSTNIG